MYVCFQLIVVIGYDCLVDKINYILSPCVTHSSAILPVLYHTGGVMPAGRVVAFDCKFLAQSAIMLKVSSAAVLVWGVPHAYRI